MKIEKIIEKTGMLLLLSVIVTFNVIIGANEKGLRVLPISILMAVILVYLIVLKFKNRKESIVFKNRVDYFVLAFMLTTTLPLIFGTYASYSDTVEFIMKYFFIYSVYLLARNVIKEKKQIECVIITTLISSLIPICLHIDYINNQYLKNFMEWICITYDKGSAFSSTFGYPNAQAIFSCMCICLAMHRFKENKNKILKAIDIIYILFSIYIIHIAGAQATMLLLGVVLFALVIAKYKKQIIKHKKKLAIGIGFIISALIVYLIIELNTSNQIIKTNEDVREKIFYNFKQGVSYTLELEYETECWNKNRINDPLSVYLLQHGRYYAKTTIAKEKLNPQLQNLKIEFTPTTDAKYLSLNIINGYYGVIIINNINLKEENQTTNYKHNTNKIGDFLNKIHTEDGKSIKQRIYMYEDCLKIAKDSPLVGNGGNAWKNLARSVEEYKVTFKESHSYFFELLISYGIIGVIAFLSLVIYFFAKMFMQCKKDTRKRNTKLLIAIGLFLLLFHSITFDFNMSFMLIQLMVYIYMAVLIYDEQKSVEKHKYFDFLVLTFLIFMINLYVRANISKYLLQDNTSKHSVTPYKKEYYFDKIKDDINNNADVKEILNELKDYIKKEQYNNQTVVYKHFFETICINIDNLSNDELYIYLNFGIERLKTVKFKTPMYFDTIFDRVNVIANTINCLDEYIDDENKTEDTKKIEIITNAVNDLKDVLYKEFEINIKNIENIENGGYSKESRNSMKQKYQQIIDSIK